MKKRELERMLWESARFDPAPDDVALSDEDLEAFHRGSCDDVERERIENLLAASAEGRRRLAELSGIRDPQPGSHRSRRIASSGPALVAAALIGALVLVGLWVSRTADQDVWTPGQFAVSLGGLAEVRSAASESEAFPDTLLRVDVAAEEGLSQRVDFGLYSRSGRSLVRLDGQLGIERRVTRDSAMFRGEASRFVGSQPGEYSLFVLVAPAERLQPSMVIPDGLSGKALLDHLREESHIAAYRKTFTLRARPLSNREHDNE
ncbi:hypothetical protein ABI59_09825 [Acidobacteria bacterium Mor1]|nr:hypothetical protein ABI59_09825 [Acidobacteria bacterium Mor1]